MSVDLFTVLLRVKLGGAGVGSIFNTTPCRMYMQPCPLSATPLALYDHGLTRLPEPGSNIGLPQYVPVSSTALPHEGLYVGANHAGSGAVAQSKLGEIFILSSLLDT
jgi:hypothetical protein